MSQNINTPTLDKSFSKERLEALGKLGVFPESLYLSGGVPAVLAKALDDLRRDALVQGVFPCMLDWPCFSCVVLNDICLCPSCWWCEESAKRFKKIAMDRDRHPFIVDLHFAYMEKKAQTLVRALFADKSL